MYDKGPNKAKSLKIRFEFVYFIRDVKDFYRIARKTFLYNASKFCYPDVEYKGACTTNIT